MEIMIADLQGGYGGGNMIWNMPAVSVVAIIFHFLGQRVHMSFHYVILFTFKTETFLLKIVAKLETFPSKEVKIKHC